MEFTADQVLFAPIERVEKMYWDHAYCPRKYRELGLKDVEVVSASPGPKYHITCRFKMKPSIEVPKFAQKFVGIGDWLNVIQTDSWTPATRKGRLDIAIDAFKSVKIHADMSLEPHPQGAVNRMRFNIECSIPLIGGQLAKFLAQDIQSKFADDCAAANKILQDY
ncbi:MAG TPA: DUF2505 domain-containing protein [Solimonas sp.]|nr:DUF2505 domain-containing protein [Solimonas sp.]